MTQKKWYLLLVIMECQANRWVFIMWIQAARLGIRDEVMKYVEVNMVTERNGRKKRADLWRPKK